jgi:hypothetical protein
VNTSPTRDWLYGLTQSGGADGSTATSGSHDSDHVVGGPQSRQDLSRSVAPNRLVGTGSPRHDRHFQALSVEGPSAALGVGVVFLFGPLDEDLIRHPSCERLRDEAVDE